MSLLNDLIDRVAGLTNRLNDIASNSKRTEEMPPMTPLERNSLIRVSKNGDSYKTSVQDIVGLFSDFDGIVQMGTLEIVPDGAGEALKIPDTPTPIWRINGQEYLKNTETIIPIPYANTGKYRTDIIVADENSDFQRIEGNEGDFIGLPPATPENTVEVTHINIFGDQIGDPSTPTLDGYITKASRNYKPISLESTTPQAIFLSQEISSFNVTIGSTPSATGTVISGFMLDTISATVFSNPYDGQDIFIRTEAAIELEHGSNSVDIPFWFADSANLEIEPNIIVHLKYYKGSNRVEFLGMATSGAGNVFTTYNTIADLLADQANQTDQAIYQVEDASADPTLTFPQGETKLQAYYKYNGVATGSLDDYTLISAPYSGSQGEIVHTQNTSDIELSGDGTDANKLEATLQPTPNSTDIFGRTDDHWQPVVRRMEEDGVRWVEVLSPNGEKLLQYSTEYFDEDSQAWTFSRNNLVNTNFDVKTLVGQINVNALGYYAARDSQGDYINALGTRAAVNSQGIRINALGISAARDSQGDDINALGYYAARDSQGNDINALGNQAARDSQGDFINAIGLLAARHAKGDDINVFGRDSYSLPGNPKCDRVNIFGPEIQPTKSDQNIISGHEFIMPLSTPATVLAGGPKSLATLETVEEMIENTPQGFTTQLIDTGGNYNDLEVTADLLVFTNENAQAILNGIWGRKEFHILNLSSQYEILINHDSSSVSGNGQPIMLPTNSGTAGIKGTARVLQTDSYGYFVADTWGSKYRPEFSELTEDKVMLVGADHRAKAEDIIELKFYRTNQSTAMDSAELENEYPDSNQGTEVICTPINKKYEKINNLGDWIEIDFLTV